MRCISQHVCNPYLVSKHRGLPKKGNTFRARQVPVESVSLAQSVTNLLVEVSSLRGVQGETSVSAQHHHGVSEVLVHVDLVSKMQHDVDFTTRLLDQSADSVPQVFFSFFQALGAIARNSNKV